MTDRDHPWFPVRLSQVRVEVRLAHARDLARRKQVEPAEILAIALAPSPTLYYLSNPDAPLILRAVAA